MDFFEAQEQAERSSSRFVALFCVAVVLIVLMVYVAVSLGFVLYGEWTNEPSVWWSWMRFWVTCVSAVGLALTRATARNPICKPATVGPAGESEDSDWASTSRSWSAAASVRGYNMYAFLCHLPLEDSNSLFPS